MSEKDPQKGIARRRGRPRSADRSALVSAQILRVDAHARRVARQVDDLLASHFDVDAAKAAWTAEVERCRRIILRRYCGDESATLIFEASRLGHDQLQAALKKLAFDTLNELAAPDEPPRSSATRRRRTGYLSASTSLASARA